MNPLARPSSCAKRKRGFTLMEMMMALAIFILLSATVFGIIVGTLKSTSTLQDNQSHRDQMPALNAFLKKQFEEIGAQSFLVSYRRGDGEGLEQNGVAFGGTGGATVIDAKAQPNGYYSLRLSEIRFEGLSYSNGTFIGFKLPQGVVSSDDTDIEWTPLIRDVRHIEWKFQDANSDLWFKEHINLGAEPNFVELSIQLAGDLQPTTMVFWIPRYWPVALTLPQSAGPNSANGTGLANGMDPTKGVNPANGSGPANGANPANGAYPANGTNPNTQNRRSLYHGPMSPNTSDESGSQ